MKRMRLHGKLKCLAKYVHACMYILYRCIYCTVKFYSGWLDSRIIHTTTCCVFLPLFRPGDHGGPWGARPTAFLPPFFSIPSAKTHPLLYFVSSFFLSDVLSFSHLYLSICVYILLKKGQFSILPYIDIAT